MICGVDCPCEMKGQGTMTRSCLQDFQRRDRWTSHCMTRDVYVEEGDYEVGIMGVDLLVN